MEFMLCIHSLGLNELLIWLLLKKGLGVEEKVDNFLPLLGTLLVVVIIVKLPSEHP
jgi:hypothetical protein